MEFYCLLCGSKLLWESEISPDETPMNYEENGIVGVYHCTNEENCNATFHIINLESENIDPEDNYTTREIRYFQNYLDF